MSDYRGLVIVTGVTRQIADGDRIIAPAGIIGAGTTDLTIRPVATKNLVLFLNANLAIGALTVTDGTNNILRITTTTGALLATLDVDLLMPAKNIGSSASDINYVYATAERLSVVGSKPGAVVVANKGWLYTKAVSGIAELFWEDDALTETQITSNGTVIVADAVQTAFTRTAGEAIGAGAPVGAYDVSGSPRVHLANAGNVNRQQAFGLAAASILLGGTGKICVAGLCSVPDAIWVAVPAVSDVGSPFYLMDGGTNGKLTLTPPSASGDVVLPMGYIMTGGTGAVQVCVNPLLPVLLA